jgi:hypothetical protein
MSFYFQYPDDWIGVPQFGDGEVFDTPRAWADALAAELVDLARPRLSRKDRPQVRTSLADAFALVGADLDEKKVQAGYLWLESFAGPLHIVTATVLSRRDVGDATLAEVAGARGDEDYVPPIVTEVTAAGGLAGVYVERHAPLDADAPHIATLSGTYAFEDDETLMVFGSSTTDLPSWESFRPHFSEFATTLRWEATGQV